MSILSAKPLFNPQGDTDKNSRRMIGGNTTNLNDFNEIHLGQQLVPPGHE